LRVGSGTGLRVLEVIGVTPSIRVTKVRTQPLPHVFLPYHLNAVETNLVIRTRADAATLGPSIKRAVEALGTARAVHDIRPMSAYVADSIADTRFTMWLLTLFGAASLVLAAIGLYGTLAYLTSQRTQEFGVRLALGATSRHILALVAGEGMVVVAIGALTGTAAAMAVTGLLQSLLYGVDRLDPATLLGVVLILAASSVVAIGQPALRASRVDPMSTLRAE
jgi:putative ABC transport system permease protein